MNDDRVLLLRGIAHTSASMRNPLETAGYTVLNLGHPSRLPIDALTGAIHLVEPAPMIAKAMMEAPMHRLSCRALRHRFGSLPRAPFHGNGF